MKHLLLSAITAVLFATPAVWGQDPVQDEAGFMTEEQYFNFEESAVEMDVQAQQAEDDKAPWGATCYARNARGQWFQARAWRARQAQNMAMQKCYRVSRVCRPMGCR